VQIARDWDQIRLEAPTKLYKPTDPRVTPGGGQLDFHCSPHPIRFLFPGNGWGKSAAMGHEVQAWMTHSNRWQVTPKGKITAVWFCPQYKQFDILRVMLQEKCFGCYPRWHVSDHYFEWPDGGRLYVASHDRDWSYLQGIPLDLCLFDEHFPERLFTEMLLRRRGQKRTRFVIAATMTKGMTWEYKHIYRPWLDYHTKRGLTEQQAINQQTHPDIFCWPYGGIADNPSMTAEDVRWYSEAVVYSSEKEKLVRLGGGFQDWSGEAVFDYDALAWMKQRMEEIEAQAPTAIKAGTFVVKRRAA
jgi:Terminase large subunit, T4likevirus-type, N-terminal